MTRCRPNASSSKSSGVRCRWHTIFQELVKIVPDNLSQQLHMAALKDAKQKSDGSDEEAAGINCAGIKKWHGNDIGLLGRWEYSGNNFQETLNFRASSSL